MELFGRQCIVVAVDVKRNYNVAGQKNVFTDSDKKFWFEVFIYGGKKETGIDAIEWIKKMESLGAGEILLTSIVRDGTLEGPDLEPLKRINEIDGINLIVSGGISNIDDVIKVKQLNPFGVILGKALYENQVTIEEAKQA